MSKVKILIIILLGHLTPTVTIASETWSSVKQEFGHYYDEDLRYEKEEHLQALANPREKEIQEKKKVIKLIGRFEQSLTEECSRIEKLYMTVIIPLIPIPLSIFALLCCLWKDYRAKQINASIESDADSVEESTTHEGQILQEEDKNIITENNDDQA